MIGRQTATRFMSAPRVMAAASLVLAATVVACAEEPACREPTASAGFSLPKGQLAAAVTGPSKQVEPPKTHIPIPDGALDSVTISLDRTECYGSCPSYSIDLKGNGTASYKGRSFVLVGGQHTFRIPTQVVRCLLGNLRRADFWSLANEYSADITDGTAARITLTIGGQSKTVVDYFGPEVGLPQSITAVEDEIDRVVASRWVEGDRETLASLKAENFDFHSQAAAQILAGSASNGPDELVFGLIDAGAPVNAQMPAPGRRVITAVENASGAGRLAVVRALIAKGAFSAAAPSDVRDRSLLGAVRSGDPQIVAEILKYRPDVNAKGYEGHTPLIAIWDAQRFARDKSKIDLVGVAQLLLNAGADPNVADVNGSTALFSASSSEVVRMLLAAGAKIDVRNKYESTPLLYAGSDEAAVALIEAGADVTVKDKFGGTIDKKATERHWSKTIDILRKKTGRK